MTNHSEDLEGLFRDRGIVRGMTLYLAPHDAIDLITAARAAKVKVLGVDAVRLSPGSTQPLLEHSLDVSAGSDQSSAWDTVSDFIKRQPSDLYFEVVLE